VATDIIFTGDIPRSTINNMVRRGNAVRLAPGVYTTDTVGDPVAIVRRSWADIAGHLFPEATITDRSAILSAPVDGTLYLAHPRRDRETELPGLRITARRGAPPQPGDVALPGGLHLASRARAMAENAMPSKSRSGKVPRRLTRHELGEWIDQTCRFDGEAALNKIRDEARRLAPVLGVSDNHLSAVTDMIGAALGTKDATDLPHVLHARRYTRPYDPTRTKRFDDLTRALRSAAPQAHTARSDSQCLPFFEAYFSNFIEGTEFTVNEAKEIVYANSVPFGRSEDAHDIMGTFQVVSNDAEMSRLASDSQEFIDLLRSRHATIMAARPDKHPGEFKERANQAGSTVFVDPDLVEGTLIEGFGRLSDLDTPWERSVLTMFLVSEIHPFDDGNGRLARLMMNSELVAANQVRTIVPTVFREDYLGALRRLSRQDDPEVLVKAMRFANDWTTRIDFSDFDKAMSQMADTNAFEIPRDGVRLLMPSASMFDEPLAIILDPPEPPSHNRSTVRPYVRADGTPVRGHQRRPRAR